MRPERPECQCLACAQLQHHQANDTLLLVAIGTVVVVGGLVWLVGQVAGLLTSGTWPDVPLSELPGVLARLREHPGDPAAAWPAGVRGGLPGPLGMYACRCCRRPSPGRPRDDGHPPCAVDRACRPWELWRGRAGEGRHQPRGGPPLRSNPPA
jgi:hypothetical protein